MLSSKHFVPWALACCAATLARAQVTLPAIPWANLGSDFNGPLNWVGLSLPGVTSVATFSATPTVQPVVGAAASVGGLSFQGNVLLSGTGTLTLGSGGLTNAAGSTSTVSAPLVFSGTSSFIENNGTLTLSGAIANALTAGLTVRGTSTTTISGALSGAGALIKSGTGRLVLSGANTFTGSTTISEGTLSIDADSRLGGGKAQLTLAGGTLATTASFTLTADRGLTLGTGGGTLEIAAGTTLTYAGTLAGSGALTLGGTGTLALGGTYGSEFSGALNINAGTLVLSNGNALGSSASTSGTTVAAGATLHFANIDDVSGSYEPLTLSGTGTGAAGVAGALTSSGYSTHVGPITLAGNTTVGVLSGGTLHLFGAIGETGGARSLTKTGTGQLYLGSSNNTYTGGTTIAAGTLWLGTDNALPAGRDVVINGLAGSATLALGNSTQSIGTLTLGGSGAAAGAINSIQSSGGTLTLGGSFIYDATNNPASGQLNGGSLSLTTGAHTVQVGNSTPAIDLILSTRITGAGSLAKTGTGVLWLERASDFTGGLTVSAGTVLLGADTAAGTGTLTLASGTTLAAGPYSSRSYADTLTLANAVTLADNVTLGRDTFDSGRLLTLSGTVTLASGASTLHLGGAGGVFMSGTFKAPTGGTGAVTFDSNGRTTPGLVALTGTIDSSVTAITANSAAVIFGRTATPPVGTTVQATNNGYIGVGADTVAPSAAAVLDRIADKAGFTGTFGFDTVPTNAAAYNFSENLSFAGFGAGLTLGSVTRGILSGTLTPSATSGVGYRFGNGGGVLFVQSALGGAHGVTVSSLSARPANALTLVLRGANTFTGAFSVENSIAILDAAGALPSGTRANLGAGGYVGATELFAPGASFADVVAARLGTYTSSSILGLDSHTFLDDVVSQGYGDTPRWYSGRIDLSALGSIYLGTATSAYLAGPILAPNQSGANRTLSLVAVHGAGLYVASPLVAGNVDRVVVGSTAQVLGSGTITLAGRSTYTGGTTLQDGRLIVSGDTALSGTAIVSGPLGTGTLTVPAGTSPTLSAFSYQRMVLSNALALGGNLQLGSYGYFGGSEVSVLSSASFLDDFYGLVLNGTISNLGGNAGSLTIVSDAALNAANTFSGGVTLRAGTLVLGNNSALGTGTLRLMPPETNSSAIVGLSSGTAARTIGNALEANLDGGDLELRGRGSFTFTGSLLLQSALTLQPGRYPVYFTGAVAGSGALTVGGYSPVYLAGANTYSGGTRADYGGRIVFSSAAAIPASPAAGLVADYGGYIGVASPTFTTSLQADFLDRFDKANTYGTIGFDTTGTGTNEFTGTINLSGFSTSVLLGSATRARIGASATIVPQSDAYRFGGGGGFLEVATPLTDATSSTRGIYVSSDDLVPLTVRFTGANTLTGASDGTLVNVSSSAAIFGSASLPATGTLYVQNGGYIGTENTTAAAQTFVDRFDRSGHDGVIGFDTTGATPTISGAIDLSTFASWTNVFLGTATSARLTGTITLPSGTSVYRFAGYKGGQLTVDSLLSGARSVQIGDYYAAFAGDPSTNYATLSSVTLAGANTYTGGTILNSGALLVGRNNALGTGTLTVNSGYYDADRPDPDMPVFGVSAAADPVSGTAIVISNPIALSGASSLLGGGLTVRATSDFTLSGVISGYGQLYKTGSASLTLLGANTFSGGLTIAEGNVTLGHESALGSGSLQFGASGSPSATFAVSATINDLAGDAALSLVTVAAGKTLTINQAGSATYAGRFAFGGASLVFAGSPVASFSAETPVLTLSGSSSSSGTVAIRSGVTILAASGSALGGAGSTVQLDGGKLAVDSGVTLANPLTVTSGTLGGAGTFQPGATVRVGSGVTLSPGVGTPGALSFNATLAPTVATTLLSLESGGTYRWQLDNATATGGWDTINVAGAVNITATSASPFSFTVVPTNPLGLLTSVTNFDPTLTYTWVVLTGTTISGYTEGAIAVNTSILSGVGSFAFSVVPNAGNTAMNLQLTYTPAAIPEPSTYALLALGGAALLVTQRRRARRH